MAPGPMRTEAGGEWWSTEVTWVILDQVTNGRDGDGNAGFADVHDET